LLIDYVATVAKQICIAHGFLSDEPIHYDVSIKNRFFVHVFVIDFEM